MSDLATTIHNERTKLTATWLNGLSIALAAVGGFAPFVNFAASDGAEVPARTVIVVATCLIASAGLHLAARKTLGKMQR